MRAVEIDPTQPEDSFDDDKDLDMFKPKPDKPAKRLVWRMSASNLAGEFVLPSARRVDPAVGAGPAEVHERWFQASSMELIEGSEVSETDLDTLPGELVDVFLGVRR